MNSEAGMSFKALAADTSSVRTWFETGTLAAWDEPVVLAVEVVDGPEPPDAVVPVGTVVDVVVPLDALGALGELEHPAKQRAPTTATATPGHDRR